ncbi:hypothetical protein THRCLA_10029 [Thraustotheca clavata]|uniref:Uncharacterized protein n=1 Tax=Thraustotheca clavata TaxID=74557 RepID=A0A1V9YT58_9STRA|nr:hypothetical protein THRCLA_10029 [Thraustotheca clavata]
MTKAQLKEKEEILAIFSDGDQLPRDRKAKKNAKQQAKKAPMSPKSHKATASPRGQQKTQQKSKQRPLTPAQLKEQQEILAIFSDGYELPRDRKAKKNTKQNTKQNTNQKPKKAAMSPRAMTAVKLPSNKQRNQAAPKRQQQLSPAQRTERDEILSVLIDGGDLPRDYKPKKNVNQPKANVTKPQATSTVKSTSKRDKSKKNNTVANAASIQHKVALTVSPHGNQVIVGSPTKANRAIAAADTEGFTPVKRRRSLQLEKKVISEAMNAEKDAFMGILLESYEGPADISGFEIVKSRRTLLKEKRKSIEAQPVCHVASHKNDYSCQRAHSLWTSMRAQNAALAISTAQSPGKVVWTRQARPKSPSSPSAEKKAQILKSLSKALIAAASPPKEKTMSLKGKVQSKVQTQSPRNKVASIHTIKAVKPNSNHIQASKKSARVTLST